LLIENCFTYFSTVATEVGPSTHDTLVGDHANRKIVGSNAMILLKHYLWGHVARSSAVLGLVLRRPLVSDTKVGESEVAIRVKYKIFWFDISVDDTFLMDGLQSLHEAG